VKFADYVAKEMVPEGTFLLGYMGSTSHGTHTPKNNPDSIDDIDMMGVAFGPQSCYVGLQRFEQKVYKQDEWDIVTYELRKYVRLLLKQNPNVLGLLWLNPNHYIHVSEPGKILLANRDMFVSKQAYHSFIGYAHGQLHRMAHYSFNGYMGAKRKELVERYGYDVKNASHLVRLLRMGIEYLGDGELQVYRKDADELREIKAGKWTLGQVKKEADRLFHLAQEAYVKSPLPAHPDAKKAQKILEEMILKWLRVASIKSINWRE